MNSEFLEFLRRQGIAFERCDHPGVFTTAEAEKLVPAMGGARAKNLFNTATLVISREYLARFLSLTGHEPRVMVIPSDAAANAAVTTGAADYQASCKRAITCVRHKSPLSRRERGGGEG